MNWLAITVRRLHDCNRSGWWLLSFLTVVGMAPLVYWLVLDGGTHGPNRFGPDPGNRAPRGQQNPTDGELFAARGATSISPEHAPADLKQLVKMRDDGLLTEEEFTALKGRLLDAV